MYAPYIMNLIKLKEIGSPLVGVNLVTHNPVRPQKKGIKTGKGSGASGSRAPFDSSDEEHEVSEEHVPDARRRRRMKHASNAPIGQGWASPGKR
jgi:hypothetical protein